MQVTGFVLGKQLWLRMERIGDSRDPLGGQETGAGCGDERGNERHGGELLENEAGKSANRAILIAGPTASGKTALSLQLARQLGASIINADSMQVYGTLRILTARPDASEIAVAPHHLFGHVPPSQDYSTGQWLREVSALLEGPLSHGPVIVTGGTGLYFSALEGNLSEMPTVPEEIRQHWRNRLEREGAQFLHAELAQRDPDAAEIINRADGQRIVRAIEIYETAGTPISELQRIKFPSVLAGRETTKFVLDPDRAWLRDRIAQRFETMMDSGAIDEVKTLRELRIGTEMPAMKAIGVRQIIDMLDGSISRETAVQKSIAATGQYAKRQSTWFRNRLGPEWKRVGDIIELQQLFMQEFTAEI